MSRLHALPALMLALVSTAFGAGDLVFSLPTENKALFENRPGDFFMYCDRTFEGEKTQPWEAGTYGMVRNPFRAGDGSVMYSRFHEGIDVKPLHRDDAGEPLDEVHPMAPGTVVHASAVARDSNYGCYVVVAHEVPEGTIYTLYAHLAAVSCQAGQAVGTGDVLGRLGHTGVGLDRVRSHLHTEVCLMLNSAYGQSTTPAANKHGNYNGMNLAGMNPADVLAVCKDGAPFSLTRYFATLQEHYRVRVPCVGTMDLLHRHPFLYKGDWNVRPVSLDIAFTAEGLPIAAYPGTEPVTQPKIISCRPMPTVQQNCTVNRVKNSSKDAALTVSGLNYMKNLLYIPGMEPPAAAPAAKSAAKPAAKPAAKAPARKQPAKGARRK